MASRPIHLSKNLCRNTYKIGHSLWLHCWQSGFFCENPFFGSWAKCSSLTKEIWRSCEQQETFSSAFHSCTFCRERYSCLILSIVYQDRSSNYSLWLLEHNCLETVNILIIWNPFYRWSVQYSVIYWSWYNSIWQRQGQRSVKEMYNWNHFKLMNINDGVAMLFVRIQIKSCANIIRCYEWQTSAWSRRIVN